MAKGLLGAWPGLGTFHGLFPPSQPRECGLGSPFHSWRNCAQRGEVISPGTKRQLERAGGRCLSLQRYLLWVNLSSELSCHRFGVVSVKKSKPLFCETEM